MNDLNEKIELLNDIQEADNILYYSDRQKAIEFIRKQKLKMKNKFNFLIYRSVEEDLSVNALVKDETIWLTQKAMAELFGCSSDNISLHFSITLMQ